jgi:hypothetical protein
MTRPWLLIVALMAVALAASAAHAQPKPADTPKPNASAVKLPDGTVVFLTKNPDDPNPVVDGVVLSAAEYQALVDQAEALKAQKLVAKPVPPSAVAARVAVVTRGTRPVAAVTVAFRFRTLQPKSTVTLGCQRAAVVAARGADGKLPVLAVGDDGVTVGVAAAGEHTLELDLEVPVAGRGPAGEVGFELALPRAAISTVAVGGVPDGVTAVNVGSRGTEPGAAVKRTRLGLAEAGKPFPLGPTDVLELTWEPAGATGETRTAESEVTVRVDDAAVETAAKVRLRGPAKEWPLVLPAGATVTIERPDSPTVAVAPATVVKPKEPDGTQWTIRTPGEAVGGEWVVSVVVRRPRPPADSPAHSGPYRLEPVAVPNARHAGKVKLFAPAGVRLDLRASADCRRQDLPAGADDDLVAVYTFAATEPKIEFHVRPVPQVVRVRPQHKLKWTPGGWRLESAVRVTPPPRGELDRLAVELPAGWTGVEFTPADLIEPLAEGGDPAGKTLDLRFATPQKTAFDFTLSATFPVRQQDRHASLPLPRFPQAVERDTRLTATVPEQLELSATGFGWAGDKPTATGEPLKPPGRGPAAQTAAGEFDRGVARVDLGWQPYRPELVCDTRAEVTVQERQLAVTQVLRFRPSDRDDRPVVLRGPAGLLGLRSNPPLEPVGPDEWECRPTEPGKEFALTVQFAVRLPTAVDGPVPVPLLTAKTATRSDCTVRVWGGGGRRAVRVVGGWRELPPDPDPDHDALPWFTLVGTGSDPLALELPDPEQAGPHPAAVVERALVQAVLSDDGTAAVRSRFVLSRWPDVGVELSVPPDGTCDLFVDGRRVEPVPRPDALRVVLPEPRAGRSACLLEVRCRGVRTGRVIVPPAIRSAVYLAPVRWSLGCGPGTVLLVPTAGVRPDGWWGWRGYGFSPPAADPLAESERWLTESEPSGEAAHAASARQLDPRPVGVTPMPRAAWVAGCSFATFVFAVGFSRLRRTLLGPAVFLAAAAVVGVGVFAPQPTAEFVAAAQPGAAVAAAVLTGVAVADRWPRASRTRQPTFSQAASSSSAPAPVSPSSGSRPKPVDQPALEG